MAKKPLGRSPGSLNAPIAAFTMAAVLCSYCIYSINTARRGAHGRNQFEAQASPSSVQRQRGAQDEWVRRALEERDGSQERGNKPGS
ncbi:hypothetical protein BJX99DRAFT_253502 [Aspergillus californicus]